MFGSNLHCHIFHCNALHCIGIHTQFIGHCVTTVTSTQVWNSIAWHIQLQCHCNVQCTPKPICFGRPTGLECSAVIQGATQSNPMQCKRRYNTIQYNTMQHKWGARRGKVNSTHNIGMQNKVIQYTAMWIVNSAHNIGIMHYNAMHPYTVQQWVHIAWFLLSEHWILTFTKMHTIHPQHLYLTCFVYKYTVVDSSGVSIWFWQYDCTVWCSVKVNVSAQYHFNVVDSSGVSIGFWQYDGALPLGVNLRRQICTHCSNLYPSQNHWTEMRLKFVLRPNVSYSYVVPCTSYSLN